MMKFKRCFIAIALVICFLIPAVPASADDAYDAAFASAIAQASRLVYEIATPGLAYPFALNKDVWYAMVDNLLPVVSGVKEELRQVALKKAPKLKPAATPPDLSAVDYVLANNYTQVISFGDSMSDNGNMFQISMDLANWGLPMPPNDKGRFSNGPVILEIMSDVLNRPLVNYAFGGAESGRESLIPAYGFYIGMLDEVDDYISNLGWRPADSKALYVIWTGPDDFYKGFNIYRTSTATNVANNIKTAMTKLYYRGARNFFIPGMPDLSITPAARAYEINTKGYTEAARTRSIEMSNALNAMLKSFARQYPLAKVRTFDTFTVLTAEKQKYADLGYNVTESCYTPPFFGLPGPVCDNPGNYLFWDMNHPTSWVSKIVGQYFAQAAVGTPLPSR
ncbi:MAG: hypothetical protein CVU55_05495 [Deltaproteobacteria bacterium HGW-Deltaproteobacteria-13]|jgi:phospholipase/lecithinase/hemolysin|nr:MAG: hypothetical protein CVU55_05495 [Deltaproteobacteria bacterium HGW-Deltaproteobacteria-13]